MSWQEKYLSDNVQIQKVSLKSFWGKGRFWNAIRFSLSPHSDPKEPKVDLPALKVTAGSAESSVGFDVANQIYLEAKSTISDLEEKGYKLLSYISSIFAFLTFVISQITFGIGQLFVFASLFVLILALIVSFRSLGLKQRKTLFVDDLYGLTETNDAPKDTIDIAVINSKLLQNAIYNLNVAMNTANILKGARNLVTVGIVLGALGVIFGFFNTQQEPKPIEVDVKYSKDAILYNDITKRLDSINKKLERSVEMHIKVEELYFQEDTLGGPYSTTK